MRFLLTLLFGLLASSSIASCSAGPTCQAGSGLRSPRRSSGKCPERINDTLSCKMAAEQNRPWDSNSGKMWPAPLYVEYSSYDRKGPTGCTVMSSGQYRYIPLGMETEQECGYWGNDCICAGAICTLCPPGWYSEGGEGSLCKKCPSDKPYTCSNDGKDCLVRGATSIASCSAGLRCEAGYGRYNEMRSSSECQVRITDAEDCKKAAERNRAWDSNSGIWHPPRYVQIGVQVGAWRDGYISYKLPRGCSVSPNGFKASSHRVRVGGYAFTQYSRFKCGGSRLPTSDADCICAESVCRACPPGWYSEGGEDPLCKKCPSDKPYTCSNDGKDCLVRGATSIASCSAGLTCKAGYERSVEMRSSGHCQVRITDAEDCKRAAGVNRVMQVTWLGEPSGCIISRRESLRGEYFFNMLNSSTECGVDQKVDCVCAKSVCTACAPGRYNDHAEASVCKACPGSSYTCSSDGKDCNARGASSSDWCKAGPHCKAGHGMDFTNGIVTTGVCEEPITSEGECRMAYSRMKKNNATITEFVSISSSSYRSSSVPPGCSISPHDSRGHFVVTFNTYGGSRRKCGDSGSGCICAATAICTTCAAGLYSTGGAGLTCKTCPSSKPFTYTCGSDDKDCRINGATDVASCKEERHCNAGQGVVLKGNITSGKCAQNFASIDECQKFVNEQDPTSYYVDDISNEDDYWRRHKRATGCFYDKSDRRYYYYKSTEPCLAGDDSEYVCLCAVTKNCTVCPSGTYSPGGRNPTCSECYSPFEQVSEDQSHCVLNTVGVGVIAFFTVAFVSLICFFVSMKYRKHITNKYNVEFNTDTQRVQGLISKLRTSFGALVLDDHNSRTTPLLSKVESGIEQGDERDCERMLEAIHQAESRCALVTAFNEILHCLETDNGRVLFQGSKNRLIAAVSAQRRDSKKKIFWDKNMSRLFGEVLSAIGAH